MDETKRHAPTIVGLTAFDAEEISAVLVEREGGCVDPTTGHWIPAPDCLAVVHDGKVAGIAALRPVEDDGLREAILGATSGTDEGEDDDG